MGGDGGSEEAALRVEFLEVGLEARGKESLHHGLFVCLFVCLIHMEVVRERDLSGFNVKRISGRNLSLVE